MLCRTANELYWMARHIERAENIARLLDVTYRMSLLPYEVIEPGLAWAEPWAVPLITSGLATAFYERFRELSAENVLRFMIIISRRHGRLRASDTGFFDIGGSPTLIAKTAIRI